MIHCFDEAACDDSTAPRPMIQILEAQMVALVRAHFFQKVAAFVCDQSSIPAYRKIARDTEIREALWIPHWPQLSVEPEHDAALFMCFLLACAMLEIDTVRAARVARQSADPEMSMKTFLSERGLLRFSVFELPELMAPDASSR
jgi:hypothetical protein